MGEAPLTATSPVAPQPPLPGMVLLTGSTHPLWRDRVQASCCPALLVAGPCPSCPLAFFSDTPAVIALSYKQGLVPFQSPGHVQSLTFLRHNLDSVLTCKMGNHGRPRAAKVIHHTSSEGRADGQPWPLRSRPAWSPHCEGRSVQGARAGWQRGGHQSALSLPIDFTLCQMPGEGT